MRILLLLLLFWIGCLNNADDKYYGSVDLSLLTGLTWMDVEQNVVGKFVPAGEEKPEAWNLKWYSYETMRGDTLYRYDTSSAHEAVRIEGDTIEFLNAIWAPNETKITKLNENELILKYIDASADIYIVFKETIKYWLP